MSERRVLAAGLALVSAVGLLVYAGLFDSWFLRDDFMWLHDAQRQWDEPSRFWTTRPSGYLRPVSNLFFGLEYAAFGLTATGYLVVNVLLHLANACLLGLLLCSLGAPRCLALAASAAAGLMVTAAPSVIWISGLVSLLALHFVLAAALFQRRFLIGGELRDGCLAFLCVALAAGSRESGVLAGAAIVLIELHHGGLGTLRARAFWRRLAPFLLLGVGYLAAQSDLTAFDAVQRQGEAGLLLPFLSGWVTNLPALVSWQTGGTGFSFGAGLALLVGLPLALGLMGGRRGLVAAAWLLGLALLALAPYGLQLASDPAIAGRYRYEAVFVAAAAIGALVHFATSAASRAPVALAPLLRGLTLSGLAAFLVVHAMTTARMVEEDERYIQRAEQTRALTRELGALLRDWADGLRRAPDERPIVLVLAATPIENERHFFDQLAVFDGWPGDQPEALDTVVLDLTDPSVRADLQSRPAEVLARAGTEAFEGVFDEHEHVTADEVRALIWDRRAGELQSPGRSDHVFGKLRYDWRRPWELTGQAQLRVLRLSPEILRALREHAPALTSPEPTSP